MNSNKQAPQLERLPSGVPGLDTILNGGFIKGGIYIVQGSPGAGKTIFGNQICFHRVRQGGNAAYVTLLAESHARMLLNLGELAFFDASVIPKSLYYLSGFSTLETDGLKGLLDLVRREVRGRGADVLIIDGLVAAEESAQNDRELKKFIHELQTQMSLTSCTTFLLTSGRTKLLRPERTMVDGLVELSDELYGSRRERVLEVSKFRGSSSLRGHHSFEITGSGIVVYPRVEQLLRFPIHRDGWQAGAPVSTGIAELDTMFGGGLPAATSTMVSGPSGSGKTSLGIHFLSSCSDDERGVYLSFYEPPERIHLKAARLGLDLKKRGERAVRFLWAPTTEHMLDAVGHSLLEAAGDQKVRRVFIDGIDGFQQCSTEPDRVVRFMTALINEFRARNMTTVYTHESHRTLSPYLEAAPRGISAILENWIALRFADVEPRLRRAISIVKARDVEFDPTSREFSITNQGVRLGAPIFTSFARGQVDPTRLEP